MSNTPDKTLELSDVAFRWTGSSTFSLHVTEFSIRRGESVLLLGESGSGKSTLLSLICGTLSPQSGDITVAGQSLTALSKSRLDRFRAENLGVIFQQFNLLPFGTVLENILLPLQFAPNRRKNAGDAQTTAETLCAALGLPSDLINQKASALSVGQQQRVAVARALIGTPPLIIADEPTSALDANTQSAFLDTLFAQTATHNTALLMVSHDPRLAEKFDRVVRIEDIATLTRGGA